MSELPPADRSEVPQHGRDLPGAVVPRPDAEDDYQARLDERRDVARAADPVLLACGRSEDGRKVLHEAMVGMAVECAALAFERRQAERMGVDVSAICSRRVSALATLGSLTAERARLGHDGELDVRDPRFAKVVNLFNESIFEVAVEVMGPELATRFLATYHSKVAGWEDRLP